MIAHAKRFTEQDGTYDGGQRPSLNSDFPFRRAWPRRSAENNMSSRLKFSLGWFMLVTIFHVGGTAYLCIASALFSPDNQLAWCWNPLAMKILDSDGFSNIMTPVVFGLPVSCMFGIFFGYLIPIIRKGRQIPDETATRNPDLAGTPWEKNSSHTSNKSDKL
jgi:hypothetical protein